jgi:hypothetical protein
MAIDGSAADGPAADDAAARAMAAPGAAAAGVAPAGPGDPAAHPRSRQRPASRYLPGWARFIIALWLICLLLLGFQQLSVLLFTFATGR